MDGKASLVAGCFTPTRDPRDLSLTARRRKESRSAFPIKGSAVSITLGVSRFFLRPVTPLRAFSEKTWCSQREEDLLHCPFLE